MQTSHLKALKQKHEKLEQMIHGESIHAARNDALIDTMKKERLHLREKIERAERTH
jgi:hypothetical protein